MELSVNVGSENSKGWQKLVPYITPFCIYRTIVPLAGSVHNRSHFPAIYNLSVA